VFTTVLLSEKALSAHDARRYAHLHDPDPVRVHVVVPSHDDRGELAEAVDDVARADFTAALHEEDADQSEAQLSGTAGRELAASLAALSGEGVAEVEGEIWAGNPVDRVVELVRELDADEVVVFSEPHLVADLTRRDWATRIRHQVDRPVLHVVLGTDQVVS
jgi:hypothetical protein